MTELEKQSNGLVYNPTSVDISAKRNRASLLVNEFNQTSDISKQNEIIKKLLGSIGTNVKIIRPFHIDFGSNTYIGNDCVINLNCTFLDANTIKIGDRVLIGPDVKMYTTYHSTLSSERFVKSESGNYFNTQAKPIKIGNDVWIGGNSTILAGVTIGDNVVIGAGSVVTKDIPNNCLAVGVPAKVLKKL